MSVVPDFRTTVSQLLQSISQNDTADLRGIPYEKVIEASGGIQETTNMLYGCIFDEIIKLQEKLITAEEYVHRVLPIYETAIERLTGNYRLHQIRHSQLQRFSQLEKSAGGYLGFVTDQRSPDYRRPYVGQSGYLLRLVEHTTAVEYGKQIHFTIM